MTAIPSTTFEAYEEMTRARTDQEDIAWRSVEWPESFTPVTLTITHLQRGYDYPISGDHITRELAYRNATPPSAA